MSSKQEFHDKLTELTRDHLESVAGGSCNASDYFDLTARIVESYENLVDAASHIIERVANASQ